ncbi:uncharacterized protein AUP68_08606 [Ilyonectria robusta]
MKRKVHDKQHADAGAASKRQRPRALQTQPRELQDGTSTRQQAERYRLVTLWKNNRWRCMITRWCETEIDRATFNISTWDWMASYGIDSVESILCHQSRSIGNLPHLCPLVLVFNIRAGPENTEGLARKLHQQHTCNRLG